MEKDTPFNYNKIEKNVQVFTKNYIVLFLVADISSMVLMPALVASYHLINGTYSHNVWYLPLVTMYGIEIPNISIKISMNIIFSINRTPYNQNSTFGHIFSHITQTTGITAIVAFMCPITTTFFAVCSYIEALFLDLGDEHNRIDGYFEGSPRNVDAFEIKKKLVDLVHSHSKVLE